MAQRGAIASEVAVSIVAIAVVAVAGLAAPAWGESAWVRGEVRINFRVAPLPTATPMGVVKTGDEVSVLERRGGWARVQAAGGAEGWLPEASLAAEAPPTQRVSQFESEVGTLRQQLAAATHERDELREQNAQLSASQSEREAAVRQLTEENRDLRAGERWPYLITGAAILGVGILAGALVSRASGRRSSPRIRF